MNPPEEKFGEAEPEVASFEEPLADEVEEFDDVEVEKVLSEAEIAELEAEHTASVVQLAKDFSERFANCVKEAETPIEAEVPRKSWKEISASAEYQAKSEHDKVYAQWEYVRESPKYKAMTEFYKQEVQMEFFRRIGEADKMDKHLAGYVINVPVHDDGLDEDEGDIRL